MLSATHFAMGFAPQLAVQSTASRAGAVSMQVGAAAAPYAAADDGDRRSPARLPAGDGCEHRG